MKKILFSFLLLIGLVAGVLFSSIGQKSLLLPLANFYLRGKAPGHRVVLHRLDPGLASLNLEGTVDETIHFSAAGPVRWLDRHFDLKYRIRAREVAVGKRRYPVQLDLKGTAKGRPDAIRVSGAGKGFDAQIAYRFSLDDSQMRGVEIRAEGARVAQLLALAGRPPYASGALDLQVNMPRLDSANPEGRAHFAIRNGTVDPKMLLRDFGIDLPRVERYQLGGDFRLSKGLVKGQARLQSPLVSFAVTDFRCDRAFRIFKSGYTLDIPELSRLKHLTKRAFYGPWKTQGEFYFDRSKGALQLKGESPSLGGTTRFFYNKGRLELTLRKVGVPQLLALTGQPALASQGSVDGSFRLTDLRQMNGAYQLRAQGRWDRVEIAKRIGSDPGEALDFRLESSGRLEKGVLNSRTVYRNRLFDLELPTLRYAFKEGAMEGSYHLNIPDLGRLKNLAKSGAHGALDVTGTLRYLPIKKLLTVKGTSPSLGGVSQFVYAGRRLTLTLKKVDGAKAMRLAGQKPFVTESQVDGVLKFSDLTRKIGTFTLSAAGTLDRNQMKRLYGIDPGPAFRVQIKGAGKIQGDQIRSHWALGNRALEFKVNACLLQLKTGHCGGDYTLNVPKLERLKTFTGRTYHGPLAMQGKIRWDGTLHLSGGGREWGGEIAYAMEDSLLRVKTQAIDAKELMKMLGYPPMIDGTVASDLHYNLASQQGTLKAESRKARFIPGPLTLVASRLLKYDLAKEIFTQVLFTSQIRGPQVVFDFSARSHRLDVSVKQGKIDRDKGRIDAMVTILDRGKRYRFRLRGPLARPGVTPVVTDALVNKARQVMQKHAIGRKIEKAVSKELKEEGNPVSNFIKKLF